MPKKKTLDFEQSLTELEAIIEKMDSGELTLEESLTAFEKGVGLIKLCQTTLQDAEQKVQKLSEIGGELSVEDFNEESDS